MSARKVPEHDIDAQGARLAALIGAALAAGGVLAALLLQIWLQAMPFKLGAVQGWSIALLVAAVLMLLACLWQWAAWRAHPAIPRASDGLLGTRASWWVHALSYVVAFVGVGAAFAVLAWGKTNQTGFWLALAAGIGLLVAQAVGATQFLRDRGLPGTVGTHIRGLIERGNARADAEAEALEMSDERAQDVAQMTPRR